MPLATRPHFNNNHKQNHKSSPSIKRYDKSHDGISTKFKATTPPSAPISTDEIGKFLCLKMIVHIRILKDSNRAHRQIILSEKISQLLKIKVHALVLN